MEPMLRRIKAKNLLSFGPEGIDLDLSALTVLIGPNGSGKSNLLEAIRLLQAAPGDLATPVREGGGIRNWIWKGRPTVATPATVEVIIYNPDGDHDLRHRIVFAEFDQKFTLTGELIAYEQPAPGQPEPHVFYSGGLGNAEFKVRNNGQTMLMQRKVSREQSILSQVKEPIQFPELGYVSAFYESISSYQKWQFGKEFVVRQPSRTDVRPNPLLEDFSNLGMFLNRLRQYPRAKANLLEKLGDLYEGLTDFELNFEGGTVQIFFTEGDFTIPATRLSDGSLRYLCLLAILLDPEPPRLVLIEEPEVGMHPDLIPKLADLLVDASSRCQLIITTHSDILIDALSEHPEAVVICEKHDGQTSMQRLDGKYLEHWLEKYRLGQLWTSGELGGVRW